MKRSFAAPLIRAARIFCLSSLALATAIAGEWDKEGTTLRQDCVDPSGVFSILKSCATFLFHDGKPVRLSIPTSVVPGGGTALGAVYIQPLDIHNWAESNL